MFVLGLFVVVVVVDLLDDVGKMEQVIGVVEVQVVDWWDFGLFGVVVGEFLVGQYVWQVVGLVVGQLYWSWVVGFYLVGEGVVEVYQWIVEGGQFLVQYVDDLYWVVWVEDYVVEVVVVVYDVWFVVIGWLFVFELGFDWFLEWCVGGQGFFVVVGLVGDLVLYVVVWVVQVGQFVGGVVDVVQFDEFVDEVFVQVVGLLFVEIQFRWQFGVQDDVFDLFYDVEFGVDY